VLAAETVIKCASGESVTIKKSFTPGGQGCAYLVRRSRTGTLAVLKLFHDRFDRAETQRRLEYLIAQRLDRLCPVLIGPRDLVVGPSGVGYVAELFPGEPLEEVLSHPGLTIFHTLTLAVALAHAVDAAAMSAIVTTNGRRPLRSRRAPSKSMCRKPLPWPSWHTRWRSRHPR